MCAFSLWAAEAVVLSSPFIAWYRTRTSAEDFESLRRAFSRVGIEIEHPIRRTGILLNVDGDHVAMRPDKIAEILCLAVAGLTVEWWLSEDIDLTCWFSYEPFNGERQYYYLEGFDSSEMARVEQAIVGLVEQDPTQTTALVIDRTGRCSEFDWDSVMYGSMSRLESVPDMLILKTSRVQEVSGLPEDGEIVELGDLSVFGGGATSAIGLDSSEIPPD